MESQLVMNHSNLWVTFNRKMFLSCNKKQKNLLSGMAIHTKVYNKPSVQKKCTLVS